MVISLIGNASQESRLLISNEGNTAKAVQVVGVLFLIAENTLIAICHPFSVHFNVITVEWI